MSVACCFPLVECVSCLACVRWAWKKFLYTAGKESESWGLATATEFEPIPRLCRYILSVYEDDLRNPIWAPPGGYGMNPDWVILKKDYNETEGKVSPYMIYTDHDNSDIILAIRGLNLGKESDILLLLDNKLGQTTYDGGYVHTGLLKAAQYVLEEECGVLRELVEKNREYSLTFVGHSLGAGVVTLLTMLAVKSTERLGCIERKRIRCFAIAPARCISLNLAVRYADVINSVVLQDDFLPRTTVALEHVFKSLLCFPCLLCVTCLKDTCTLEEKKLQDPRRLYAPGRLYHIIVRKPFRCKRITPLVRTAVPVDGRATPKVKITLSKIGETRKRHSHNYATPPMSVHAVSLLFEAIFLKAKSLQALGRYKEAAQSCSVILDIVESSLPAGMPENSIADHKLQETLNKAVESLPELWKLADSSRQAILSYRRSLLHPWNLDVHTIANIQKEFAVYLLYSGTEIVPPDLRSQIDTAFVPKNNIEEAILLLIILLRKASLKRIEWDPSILDHLTYALSISGGLGALAHQVEELLPGAINRDERYHTLALCYHGEGFDPDALNLWRKMSKNHEDLYLPALLFFSRICGGKSEYFEDGINFSIRAIDKSWGGCDWLNGAAHFTLGLSLSAKSKSDMTDSDRVERQYEALRSLDFAGKITKMDDPVIVYHLCLENAEQRKLDAAVNLGKKLILLEGGSNIRGWVLLARVLSAKKCFTDAENIVKVGLDQIGIWEQGELLRTKGKLQIAQGRAKEGIETYSQILAVLQVQRKSFGSGNKENRNYVSKLELETWHDLASIYIKLCRWHDAEICISKFAAISAFSALRWHAAGLLQEARSNFKEALTAYTLALEIDPTHIPSLVSKAIILRRMGYQSSPITRSFLTDALRLDRMRACTWHNLGQFYKDGGNYVEAAECFQAAAFLEETEPIEPFR